MEDAPAAPYAALALWDFFLMSDLFPCMGISSLPG